jgi:putative oxidoreductase
MTSSASSAHLRDLGLLVLRVTAGGVGLLHGGQKIFQMGVGNFAKHLEGMNVPMPEVSAWLAALAEFGGGALIVLGLLTRLATVPFIFTMGVAFFVAHKGVLIGEKSGEQALVVGLMLIAILLTGPGRFSLDAAIFGRKRSAPAPKPSRKD